jgi:lipopolysaccharide biosynthesis glycosyltransferase
MASVWSNASRSVCIHIVHDETLTESNRHKLRQIAADFGQQLCFYPVPAAVMDPLPACGPFTCGTLYRLFLPQLLSQDKVIYLDCDVVVGLDVAELWQTELAGLPLAAVGDWGIERCSAEVKQKIVATGIDLKHYLNSGVLILDLKQLRQQSQELAEKLSAFLTAMTGSNMVDQDFLNLVFQNRWYRLDEKYNRMISSIANRPMLDTPEIWHFCGIKPWVQYENPYSTLYWRYLLKTPWRAEVWRGVVLIEQERNRIQSSLCWRWTKPYRFCGDSIKKLFGV